MDGCGTPPPPKKCTVSLYHLVHSLSRSCYLSLSFPCSPLISSTIPTLTPTLPALLYYCVFFL